MPYPIYFQRNPNLAVTVFFSRDIVHQFINLNNGVGIMGSGMVKNLLNSGHQVTVWNRTTEKVDYSLLLK